MLKFFICSASASIVGTEANWKLKAYSEKEALDLFSDEAIQYIESIDNVSEYEEENGIEYEYKYYVREISEKEFKNLKVTNLS